MATASKDKSIRCGIITAQSAATSDARPRLDLEHGLYAGRQSIDGRYPQFRENVRIGLHYSCMAYENQYDGFELCSKLTRT